MSDQPAESVRDEDLIEVWAHIGNIIRLAAALELREIDAACRRAGISGLHAMLLNPAQSPESSIATQQNTRLLDAFRMFRSEIERAAGADGAAVCSRRGREGCVAESGFEAAGDMGRGA